MRAKKATLKHNQRGALLLIVIITLPFLILLATYYMHLGLTSFQVARFDELHTSAQLAADAGADYAIEQIGQNNSWGGTNGEVQLHHDSTTKTTYAVTVTNGANTKTLNVIGRTYWPASATTASRSVSIDVQLRPVTTGAFSVISGEGGLTMNNNSKIVGGNVFINGGINLSNSAQIGLSTAPVNVQVADQTCPNPPDATYPQVCAAGQNGQPITLSNNSVIYGNVTATNQTNGSKMFNSGLVSGGTVAPQALPTYNRSAQKAAVTNTMTGAAASCSGKQTQTWPANTKITGNVTISTNCVVTVNGNVWITGSLSLTNSAEMVVANSLGTTVPNIMIDGSGGATFSNGSQLVSNSSSTGFEIYTFWSTASCSPDCASVTGTDLANSRTQTTIALNNSSSAPNTIFYAYWSQVTVSNTGEIGAVIGQTVNLSNAGTITFGSSTTTGSIVWVVQGYRRP
jgi:Tfp pilus assembly protein PilX